MNMPLHCAVEDGNIKVVRLLLKHCGTSLKIDAKNKVRSSFEAIIDQSIDMRHRDATLHFSWHVSLKTKTWWLSS
jgi:hypothetical protein